MISRSLRIILLSSFFITGIYVEIGFALKPFLILGFVCSAYLLLQPSAKLRLSNYDWFFFLLVVYGTINVILVGAPIPGARMIFGSLIYFFSYIMIGSALIFKYQGEVEKLEADIRLLGIVIVGLSLIFYGWTLLLTPRTVLEDPYFQNTLFAVEFDRGIYRLKGLTHDPNIASLTALFFLAFTFCSREKWNWENTLLAASSLLMLTLTASRAGMLTGLSVGLGYLSVFALSRRRSLVISYGKSAFLVSIVLAVILFLWGEVIDYAVSQRLKNVTLASGRFKIWADAWIDFSRNPVLGVGWFTYVTEHRFVHNTYLEVLTELGIVGALIYGIYLSNVFIQSGKIAKRCASGKYIKVFLCAYLMMAFTLSLILYEVLFLCLILMKIYRRAGHVTYHSNILDKPTH